MESKIELCIRNFPDSLSESDILEFLEHFGISAVKFLKRRNKISAIASLPEETVARCAISRLHQLKILDRRLSVEYYRRPEVEVVDADTAAPPSIKPTHELSNFVKALHALQAENFSQPPPPYLKYRYPKPTREIIDSICVALESVPKFYTQVLHLMNRMNLPPPFVPSDLQRTTNQTASVKKDACQQTDVTCFQESLLAEGESELESDEELQPKRKQNTIWSKNRFKPYTLPKKADCNNKVEQARMFAQQQTIKPPSIKMRIPDELRVKPNRSPPISQEVEEMNASPEEIPAAKPSTITEEDLLENRIPQGQLAELPVFKNYTPGLASNKLYVKNLAKTVTEADLKWIYHHFAITSEPDNEIDIKLMQSGRMKGQAFITFSYVYEEDLDRLAEKPAERALRLTNGFLLKDKPMVVSYGRAVGKGETGLTESTVAGDKAS
ncbi:RNA-binding region-containing protein 3 [Toxorhynchites rutilus septentrionalis]|uniref:RNA-binding region-containing protein 3 n=1 Tax=Toxorhynchites rutilus septentrionalis TaxID=329112 RepID=UPI00247AE8CF|nr:RNA-binding region-containing protein 3 [Toxorhynchites rutilus septentrionalis]